ncbi:cbb3-type cytochrome oxidase assembly protein CcoS [Neisseria leonii]|uniref:Cbb3-type cytochrome oxidase assembly protein CcoS n=1 Tax=Neisseria leonii TaxID=2995413 RepID=A0A9X4E2B9_9NEIS|nr:MULTISPECIES: cbb3-type cytochrome oxidase assembly protein CcoS [unclassified Neisseria]MDD9326389.1 cbb3-type cytochrome oxidase assembly protein CcoS [Neisseria sp. 3986]MDD9328326.1 cbb3-type cytochrome oxidase assembly protein CcoS [Neisseria sp. 51.81]
MESLFILIPISIVLAAVIIYFFWWSGKNGQFDDLEGPAHRILMDDDNTFTAETPPQTKDRDALS